ncbi:MAG: PH domain-containing protein [Gemmatimonadota bacterium]
MPMNLERLPTEIRPSKALLRYYALAALVAGPGYPFLLADLFFRYLTLRYRLDDDGISMRWGALFRREVSLNYGRIQDIHLSSNVVERWLGLGKIQVQTASASSKAEMTIEGVPDLAALRDFLYDRMRGARAGDGTGAVEPGGPPGAAASALAPPGPAAAEVEALARTLRQVAEEVRALRETLGGSGSGPDRAGGSGAGSPDREHAGGGGDA